MIQRENCTIVCVTAKPDCIIYMLETLQCIEYQSLYKEENDP